MSSDDKNDSAGGSGVSDGAHGVNIDKKEEKLHHGKHHLRLSTDNNNKGNIDLEEQPQLKRLKLRHLIPISQQLAADLAAKEGGDSLGSGNRLGHRSPSAEGSAQDPAARHQQGTTTSQPSTEQDPNDSNRNGSNQGQGTKSEQIKGPVLGQVHSSLNTLYAWYNSSRNAYLEQAKSFISLLEQQSMSNNALMDSSGELNAVQNAVEVSIQIMKASAEVEARQSARQNSFG